MSIQRNINLDFKHNVREAKNIQVIIFVYLPIYMTKNVIQLVGQYIYLSNVMYKTILFLQMLSKIIRFIKFTQISL